MTDIKSQINKISQKFAEHFVDEDGQKFLNAFKGEEETQRDSYKGREILELLQNAVDALAPNSGQKAASGPNSKNNNQESSQILIRLRDNIFTIYNTGAPFELAGLDSLAYPHNSPKVSVRNSKFIGHKGLGFRSVLNWAETIRIYSQNGLRVSYNAVETNQFYRENLAKHPSAIGQYSTNLEHITFPTLSYPKYLEQPRDLGIYTTCIELELLPEAVGNARLQMQNLESTVLLFLPDVSELIIDDNGARRTFSKKTIASTNGRETVELSSDDQVKTLDVYKKSGAIKDGNATKKYEIKLALDNEIGQQKNYIYSYFRTKIRLPLNWHLHATFDLNAERNEIQSSAYNQKLLNILQEFFFQTAEQIALESKDYTVANSLKQDYSFDNRLDLDEQAPSFADHFEAKKLAAKILPTLSGELISINSRPQIFQTSKLYQYVSELDGVLQPGAPLWLTDGYSAHLSSPSPERIFDYFDHLRRREPLKSDLETRAEIAYLLYREYRYISHAKLPALFASNSSHQSPIKNGQIYVGAKEDINNIPSFIRLKFLHPDQYNYLLRRLSTDEENITTAAELAEHSFGKFYQLKTITIDNLLAQANNYLRRQSPTELQAKFPDYLNFIFAHLHEINEPEKNIILLARDHTLQSASALYFGQEYDETLCENLFQHNDAYFLESADYYHQDQESFKQQLLGLVETMPRRTDEWSDSFRNEVYYCYNFDHFDQILDAEPQYFFQWLIDVFANVTASEIQMGTNGRARDNKYDTNYSKVYREIRARAPFLTQKAAYDFDHVLHGDDGRQLGENVDGLFGCDLAQYFRELGVTATDDQIDKVIALFNIPQVYKDLDVDTFYNVLQALPSFDHAGEISTKLYNSVTRDDIMSKKISRQLKNQLIIPARKDLKVFTNKGYANQGFVDADKAAYAIYKEPSCFSRVVNFMEIQKHTNKEHVYNIFGVKTFDRGKVEIVNNPSPSASIFDELTADIEDLKPYILAIRLGISQDKRNKQQDLRHIQNLTVIPTQKLIVSYDHNQPDSLDELDFLRDGNSDRFYIVTGREQSFSKIKDDPKYANALRSIIAIAVDADQDLDIVTRMVSYKPAYREDMYLDDGRSPELLQEARLKLGVASQDSVTQSVAADFTQPNCDLIEQVLNNNSGRYVTAIHQQLSADREHRQDFRRLWQQYDIFDPSTDLTQDDQTRIWTETLSQIDAQELLKKYFPELDYNLRSNQASISARAAQNRLKIYGHFSGSAAHDLVEKYLTNPKHESLLYFDDELTGLISAIEKEVQKQAPAEQDDSADLSATLQPANVEIVRTTKTVSLAAPSHRKPRRIHASSSLASHSDTNRRNEENGGRAELAVRCELDRKGYHNIKWHSAYATNFKYAGEKYLEDRSDDSVGYDLSYDDENGVRHYVEVKSCDFDDHKATVSNISQKEFEFAKAHPDVYDLYLVKIVDGRPDIKIIEGFCNKEFNASANDYTLTFSF